MNVDHINNSWQWTGVKAKKIIDTNNFGYVIFEAEDGKYWIIRPEQLSCKIVALNLQEFDQKKSEESFIEEWACKEIIQTAENALGELKEGETYCLKLPVVFGGLYEAQNYGTIDHDKLIALCGEMGFQIKDLPDGSKIEFDV